jgi:hypothetical protein
MKGRFVMKKICLALLVLIVSIPAMGAVNITLTQGPEPNSAIIGYQCTNNEKVRAFSLDVTVSDSALIVGTIKRMPLSEPNYYLTPTNVGFTSLGTPSTLRAWPYNAPVVSADANGCIVETASLYALTDPCVAHRFAPPASGELVKLFVNPTKTGCDGQVVVTITGANAKRGGVVHENGSTIAVNLPSALTLTLYTGPLAWLGASQAKGDATADGIVELSDLLALRKSWNKTPADPHGTNLGQYNCAADFTRDGIVELSDLLVLRQNWNAQGLATCPANCPP